MADKKTRLQKAQAEIRKLKQENDSLKMENDAIKKELLEISMHGKEKRASSSAKKSTFLYLYDTVVSALILVFVYWIAINGHDSFDVPYKYWLILVVMISVKCLFDNKEFYIKPIFLVIVNDLAKPAISMLVGLFLCLISLGEAWKGAKGYALDVANTLILVMTVTIVVMIIVAVSYLVIAVIKLWGKIRGSK